MQKLEPLFDLIKSLTKSEKRFFKIYSSRHVIGNENNYVKLFDAINQQPLYNETALLQRFKTQKFAKRLSVAKTYLYELILKSMNACHASRSLETQIADWLGQARFLLEKGLYQQSLKWVNKAKKAALEREKTALLPQIVELHKQIIDLLAYQQYPTQILRAIYDAECQTLEQLVNKNEYWLLQAKLYAFYNDKGMMRNPSDVDQLAGVFNSPLLKDEKQALSHAALISFYRIYATYFFIARDFKNCYQYSQKLVQTIESRPDLRNDNQFLYVQSVNNLLNMTTAPEKAAERQTYLQELALMLTNESLKHNEPLQIKLFEAYYYHQITGCISTGRFFEGEYLIAQLEEGLQRWYNKIDAMGQTMLCFYGFHLCFGCERFAEAYRFLVRILAMPPHVVRDDIYCFSRILSLLAAYELGTPQILKKCVQQTYKYLVQRQRRYQFESLVVQFLRQVVHANTELNFQGLLHDLHKQLLELQTHHFESKALAYFDFVVWVESKLQNKSFATVMGGR